MESKKMKKAVIATIATVAGAIGGFKLYMQLKKDRKAQNEEKKHQGQ